MNLKTVFSNIEPTNKEVVWISIINGVPIQKIYTSKGWRIIGSPVVGESLSSSLEEITDKYVFKISNENIDLIHNIDTASDIGLSKTVNVHIIGSLYGVSYDTVGVYHNGEISAVQGDTHIVFDVNFDTGVIKIKSYFDLSTYIEGVQLDIGNNDEVKSINLEKLRRVTVKTNVFSTHIDYGIGVGSWTDGIGGFAHIITAEGYDTYYDINIDGSVTLNSTYVSPTSLYGEYKAWGGTKTKEDFNTELFELIG